MFAGYNLFVVQTLDLHRDEGWYLYASQLVYRGEVPYLDFAYFQSPLLPYIYGLPQLLAGPGILVGRLTSLVFSIASAVVTVLIARRLGGNRAGIIALLCLVASPEYVRVGSYANNAILSTFLGLLGCWALLSDTPSRWKQVLAAASWGLAVLARLSSAPALAYTLGVILWRHRRRLTGAWPAWVVAAVVVAGGLGVFAFLDVDRVYFNLVVAQLGRRSQVESLAVASNGVSNPDILLGTLLMYAPALLLILVLGPTSLWRKPGWGLLPGNSETHSRSQLLHVAALIPVVYVLNLLPGDPYPVYLATAYPLACILASGLVVDRWREQRWPSSALTALVGSAIAIGVAASALYLPGITSWWGRGLQQLEDLSRYVEEVARPSGTLLTFETALAANTGRDVVKGAAMSYFSYFPNLTPDQAVHYHVLNSTLLSDCLSNHEADLAVLTDFDIHLTRKPVAPWRAEPVALTQAQIVRLFPELEGRYVLAKTVDDYGPWHTHLYILKSSYPPRPDLPQRDDSSAPN
jgi:4-amino-4-deoxy-L-arabinose transferase-like glycosyltransferase